MTDREFLEFIASATDEEASLFYDSLSLDELAYYSGLIRFMLYEATIEQYEYEIEAEKGLAEAKQVLKKIMEK